MHKAYQVIGERVIIYKPIEQKLGIFQKSGCLADIDFVQVLDKTDDLIEELAMGRPPRERINPNNPILHLYMGVDLKRLKYDDVVGDAHIFEVEYFPEGDLPCSEDIFFNDGNNELYNLYKGPLKQAGFKIE